MDKIDFLTDVYEDYCTKHSLPYVSADEQDLTDLDQNMLTGYATLMICGNLLNKSTHIVTL